MKILKYIVLEMLLLIAMLFCGTAVTKILGLLFKIGYENIWITGFKVGFAAWLILLVFWIITLIKRTKKY
jgi:uncharacterized membrane protein